MTFAVELSGPPGQQRPQGEGRAAWRQEADQVQGLRLMERRPQLTCKQRTKESRSGSSRVCTWLLARRWSPRVHACVLSHFSHVRLFATPWTVARQVRGILQVEYWSGLPCHPPRDLPHPGIKPVSLLSTYTGRRVLYY